MTQKTKRGEATAFLNALAKTRPWPNECVYWPYARNAAGYAVFGKKRGAIRSAIVARVACEIVHGTPADRSLEAAHSCGNGHLGCINPAHVTWKTSRENKADQIIHGTRNRGDRNGRSKISSAVAQKILEMAVSRRNIDIALEVGLDPSTVSMIVRGKRWGHLQSCK